MISDSDLAALEAAAAVAAPGPWWHDNLILMIPDEPDGDICHKRMVDMGGEVGDNSDFDDQGELDAKFVAMARNKVPELVKELQSRRLNERIILKGDAQQDQQIAEGAAWMNASQAGLVVDFFNKINDGEICRMGDAELSVLRSMALIGFHEVAVAAVRASDEKITQMRQARESLKSDQTGGDRNG